MVTDVEKRWRFEEGIGLRGETRDRGQWFDFHGQVIREIPRRFVADRALRFLILENGFSFLLLGREARGACWRLDQTFAQKHAEGIDVIIGHIGGRIFSGVELRAFFDAFFERFAFATPAIRTDREQATDEHGCSSRYAAHFFGWTKNFIATEESFGPAF